jgi:hypothetical protein
MQGSDASDTRAVSGESLTVRMIAWVQWLMLYSGCSRLDSFGLRLERIEGYLVERFIRDKR